MRALRCAFCKYPAASVPDGAAFLETEWARLIGHVGQSHTAFWFHRLPLLWRLSQQGITESVDEDGGSTHGDTEEDEETDSREEADPAADVVLAGVARPA